MNPLDRDRTAPRQRSDVRSLEHPRRAPRPDGLVAARSSLRIPDAMPWPTPCKTRRTTWWRFRNSPNRRPKFTVSSSMGQEKTQQTFVRLLEYHERLSSGDARSTAGDGDPLFSPPAASAPISADDALAIARGHRPAMNDSGRPSAHDRNGKPESTPDAVHSAPAAARALADDLASAFGRCGRRDLDRGGRRQDRVSRRGDRPRHAARRRSGHRLDQAGRDPLGLAGTRSRASRDQAGTAWLVSNPACRRRVCEP